MNSDIKNAKLAEFKASINNNSPARKRLTNFFDEGIYTEINAFVKEGEEKASVITAYGYVDGNPVYVFSQDKDIAHGAIGKANATKTAKIYELAAKTGIPVVGIYDSNGAFVNAGFDALSAYGEMLKWTCNLSGVVPQISVIAGTCAGSSAMLACSADFVIMTKDSELFMAPPFNSNGVKGAGTAENASKSGTASLICEDDTDAMEQARRLVTLLPANNLSPVPLFEFSQSTNEINSDIISIVNSVFDEGSVFELSSDFGTAAYTAFATISGATVGVIATNKINSKLTIEDSSKIARFIRTCDAFAIPVITFVDTEGFDVNAENELTGSIRHLTKLASAYAEATTVKISIITGKAIGSAFIALAGKNANSDITYAWPNAVISPLAIDTAVEFLWHDKLKGTDDVSAKRTELCEEYSSTVADAISAAENNCINDVILPEETRNAIITALDITSGKRESRLPKKHSNMPF